jgi:hypothetical protein
MDDNEINRNNVLMVEGSNDLYVTKAICEKFNLPELFKVHEVMGFDNITIRLGLEIKNRWKNIGIVIDADTDLSKRWNEILKLFQNDWNFQIPLQPGNNGTIFNLNEKQRIGIWIMPNNELNGNLEDFIRTLVPAKDKLISYAESVLESIENKKINKYNKNNHTKALIHTWLAWQKDPGTPLGFAITKTYLTHNSNLSRKYIEWIKSLFMLTILQ